MEENEDLDFKSDEKVNDKVTAISRDVISKTFSSKWVADSSVFSHMTDKLQLFSGPLTQIRRRKIKIKGKRLYADYCGTVMMQDQKRNSIQLSSVLYVPKLDINLLSEK